MDSTGKKNRLANSASPYLQQHANNPVDWFTWGEEALTKARQENKPILLSIGYSACHWCHVMAHESFEDQTTADLMNKYFINIKVDREERPDIDKIYQTTHTLLINKSGGWPLTMFMDPQTHAPFFSGTYFPNQPRHGLPSFKEVLVSLADYFTSHPQEIDQQGSAVKQAMQRIYAAHDEMPSLPAGTLENARNSLLQHFDKVDGGFGNAPKFPQPFYLEFLIHYWAKSAQGRPQGLTAQPDQQTIYAALHTLKKMSCSGVYDQIGGGFYRYSVDQQWMIPHFEKMLYDNGCLLSLLSDAVVFSDTKLFTQRVEETADWVMREMQAPEGGYQASIDADSEGEEGLFYVWDQLEIDQVLSADEATLVRQYFNLDAPANFEGKWHLHITTELSEVADANTLARAKQKLFEYRKQRIAPHLDSKILTAWNALTIKGMAKAAMATNNQRYADSAQKAFSFIYVTMWNGKRLQSCWNNGVVQPTMYLDDCAFLLDATLHLLQLRWDEQQFSFALSLANVLLEQFEDKDYGGYFFTPAEHETLLERPRTLTDEAVPCGYGIATSALIRLGLLSGNMDYLASAERALAQANGVIAQDPIHYTTLLCASDIQQNLPEIIILRGDMMQLPDWQRCINKYFSPQRHHFAIPSNAQNLPTIISDKKPPQDSGTVFAYICQGTTCQEPLSSLDDFDKYLNQTSATLSS